MNTATKRSPVARSGDVPTSRRAPRAYGMQRHHAPPAPDVVPQGGHSTERRSPTEQIRNVALVGPRRDREDHPGRGAAAPCRRHHPGGTGRGRHHGDRLRTRGAEAGASRCHWRWPRSNGRATRSTCIDTPATPTSWATCRRRCEWPTSRCSWSAPSRAWRSRPTPLWKIGRRARVPRMVFVNKLDRERPTSNARWSSSAIDVRRRRRAAGAADRRGGAFRGVADLLTDTAYIYDGGGPTAA